MANKLLKPRDWPPEIQYIARPSYSQNFPKDIFKTLHSKSENAEVISASDGPSRNVQIQSIISPTHPAHGQFGLFANKHLPAGSFILFYIGEVHSEQDTDPSSDYDLSLDRDLQVGIDASCMGNEARFINDYRGISDHGANAEFREVWVTTASGSHERRMAVFVLPAGKSGKRAAGIKKGEEILVSYGKGFWKERQAPVETT